MSVLDLQDAKKLVAKVKLPENSKVKEKAL